MNEPKVKLTPAEADAFALFIQEYIFTEIKNFCANKEEFEYSDQVAERKDINNWWTIYDKIRGGQLEFESDEDIRSIVFGLHFGIFDILADDDCYIDNPAFLYDVMQVWKKFADYMEWIREKE